MKKTLGIILLVLAVIVPNIVFAGTPHLVYGTLKNNDGSTPANGEVTFRAFIKSRTGEVLTQNSTGCSYSGGYWNLGVGNFATAWSAGDVLRIEFHHVNDNVDASDEITLTNNDPEDAGQTTLPAPAVPQYTLTMAVSPQGGGTTTPAVGGHDYDESTVVDITAAPAAGYEFVNWTGDVADANSANTTVTMDANKTVTANFQLITRILTMAVNPQGGGTTTPAIGDHDYDHGTVVDLTATPAAGYEFVSWTGDVADANSANTTVTMDANKTVTANFQLITRILTMAVNPQGGGTTTPAAGNHNYDHGTVVDITATPTNGWRFVNWTGDVADANSANTTVTMNANKTVTANFEEIPPNQYALTMAVNPQGGGTTTPAVGTHTYNEGTVVNLTATPAVGYEFVSWTGDVADANSANTTVTMDANKTVTANFQLITRILTMAVNPQGGGTTTPAIGDHDYDHGTVVDLTATPAAGYEFVNWTGDVADANSANTTVTMNANKTVTANFQRIQYTLTMAVTPQGGGTTVPIVGNHNYNEGTVVNIAATPAANYEFVNWTGDVADANSANTTVTMNANKTVTANFQLVKRTLTVAVNPQGGGTTTPAVGDHDYDHGTVVDLTATPAQGWFFLNWTGDVADPNSATTTVTMDANKTVTANFTDKLILTMQVTPENGGTTTPAVGNHEYDVGAVVDITATPLGEHEFLHWEGDVADPNSPNTTVTMDNHKTVKAVFSPPRYELKLNASPETGGTTKPSPGEVVLVEKASFYSIKAIPAAGYKFVGWTGDVNSVQDVNSASTLVQMYWHYTITANFEPETTVMYKLTMEVSPKDGGTTSPVLGEHEYVEGSVVSISATAANGYRFVNWTGDVADPNDQNTTVTMGSDKTVKANFELIPPNQFVLTMSVSPQGSGTTDPSVGTHNYNENTVVDIKATPGEGFEFVNWTGDVADPNSANTTVTMDANKTVTANFQAVKRVLTVTITPQNGGQVLPAVGDHEYDHGTVVDLNAIAAEGFEFDKWTGDVADPNNASTTITMDADKTVDAVFKTKDIQKPILKYAFPANNAQAVPQNCKIQFKLIDDEGGEGLDNASLNVAVNGQAIWTNGVDQTNGLVSVAYGSIIFKYEADQLYEPGSTVTVDISCADLAANQLDTSYSFIIGNSDVVIEQTLSVDQNGGSVIDEQTGVEITIPESALTDSVEITIGTISDPPALPDTANGLGLTYHFGPDGIQFEDSVVIKIPYTQDDLAEAGVTDPLDLTVYYYSSSLGEWVVLKVFDADADFIYIKVKEFCYLQIGKATTSSVADDVMIPTTYSLSQNYPNPFNPTTMIQYGIPKVSDVRLQIFDITGREIYSHVEKGQSAGIHQWVWNACNHSGQKVPSGVYFIKMQASEFNQVRKMMLIR